MGSVKKIFKKATKVIKKPISKITKGIARGVAKVAKSVMKGVGKLNAKLGPIGMIAMSIAMPYALGGLSSMTTAAMNSSNVFLKAVGTVGNQIRLGYQAFNTGMSIAKKSITDVIGKTCFEMNKLGQAPSIAIVGPCIYPENYEFDRNDLAALEKTFGVGIKSKTKYGRPALDLPAMVRLALSKNGVKNVTYLDGCTADSEHFWSHRANCDQERQAMVAWIGNN